MKMQKRGQADCPLCRAPVVLSANKCKLSPPASIRDDRLTDAYQSVANVDWALLNFMQDWFPVESKEKLKSNEREAAREEMEELGLDPDQGCVLM